MDTFSFEIVRPDKLMLKGDALSMVLITQTGELGILPGHASEICVLGDGVMRVEHTPQEDGRTKTEFVVKGGYAEITPTKVIVLADHARARDDIYQDIVEQTKKEAQIALAQLGEQDSRRVYFDTKIAWCDLLLEARKGK